jgi:hypothetical protein
MKVMKIGPTVAARCDGYYSLDRVSRPNGPYAISKQPFRLRLHRPRSASYSRVAFAQSNRLSPHHARLQLQPVLSFCARQSQFL